MQELAREERREAAEQLLQKLCDEVLPLAGAVPVKTYNPSDYFPKQKLPFSFLLMEESSCGGRIGNLNFLEARHSCADEFLSLPTLTDAFKDAYRDLFQAEFFDSASPATAP